MKLFSYREIAYQWSTETKQTSYITIHKFTNLGGWLFWCSLISIHKIEKDWLLMFFPQQDYGWIIEINDSRPNIFLRNVKDAPPNQEVKP